MCKKFVQFVLWEFGESKWKGFAYLSLLMQFWMCKEHLAVIWEGIMGREFDNPTYEIKGIHC